MRITTSHLTRLSCDEWNWHFLGTCVSTIRSEHQGQFSLSERRQRIRFEPFAWLMKHALKPMADEQIDNSCFYKGWRLCGIDGSSWSVTNTPQILGKMTKAAFAKIEMCVLVELGLHNPLAAEVGLKGEGEWTLSARLLENLPECSLLLIDRLYGCGKYLAEIIHVGLSELQCGRENENPPAPDCVTNGAEIAEKVQHVRRQSSPHLHQARNLPRPISANLRES